MPFNTGTRKERHSGAGVPRNPADYAPCWHEGTRAESRRFKSRWWYSMGHVRCTLHQGEYLRNLKKKGEKRTELRRCAASALKGGNVHQTEGGFPGREHRLDQTQ